MRGILTIVPAQLRQGTVLVLMVLCLALLGGCAGGGSKPFAKGEGTPGPGGKPVPPIALLGVSGIPAAQLSQFKDALAIAAGKRDMAIIDSKLDNTTLTLTGHFTIAPEATAVRLGYNWTLTDPTGAVLHTISADETAPGAPAGDPWLQITPTVLERVAAYTAESLSSRLSQLGYATEVGGIPPPLETYAKAGPDADKDIDYETLFGPGKGPASVAEAQVPIAREAVANSEPAVANEPFSTAAETEALPVETDKAALTATEAKARPAATAKATLTAAEAQVRPAATAKAALAATEVEASPGATAKTDFAAAEVERGGAANDKADFAAPEAEALPAATGKADFAAAEAEPTNDKAVSPKLTKSELGGRKQTSAVTEREQIRAVAARKQISAVGARKQISAVAVLPVVGAPGTGNADLTKAMRQTLSEAGWPVLTKPRANAITILGDVKLGPKQAKSQQVALAWTVKSPDGRTLGTVKQANIVPAGSLEGGFGDNALFAAQAAASGIYDLVKKYR
jgi:hypothetical protein